MNRLTDIRWGVFLCLTQLAWGLTWSYTTELVSHSTHEKRMSKRECLKSN